MERWEFTEVDNPRRRRGQEMRRVEALRAAGKSTSKSVPIDRLTKQAERVPGWIRKRCKEKVAKHYSGRADLLIYLNWSEFGVRHAEIERTFSVATASAKEAFTEVWILWKDRLYRTWRLRVAAETVKDAPGTHYP